MAPKVGSMSSELAPTESPTVHDILWASGFLEGDGSFHKNGISGKVQVGQTKPWVLHRLRALFGGSLRTKEHNGVKKGEHFHWLLTGARARGLMMTIYGRMSPHRKQQIRRALGKEGSNEAIQ